MGKFKYNEDSRIHTLGGKVIPSVTQVIEPVTDFSMVPLNVLARKTELGINFHKAIELHHLNDLCFDSLDPDLVAPMETYIKWWPTRRDYETALAETPAVNSIFEYCGKPDISTLDGIYDFKLRVFNPITDTLQMAGYSKLGISAWPRHLTCVCFDIKGGIKVHDAKHKQAWGMFRLLLEAKRDNINIDNEIKLWKGSFK